MFQLLADGTVDKLADKIKAKGIPFGFGGLAQLNTGMLSGEKVLKEHYRLGSSMVIVSRSFCNTDVIKDMDEVNRVFHEGIKEIRDLETKIQNETEEFFIKNQELVIEAVNKIIS